MRIRIPDNYLKTFLYGGLFSIFAWVYFCGVASVANYLPSFFEELIYILGGPVVFFAVTYGALGAFVLARTGYFDRITRIAFGAVVSVIFHVVIYQTMLYLVSGDTVFAVIYMMNAAIAATIICTIILLIVFFRKHIKP